MLRDIQHITVYRDPSGKYNAAFPELALLTNGDLLVSFREALYGPGAPQGAGHNHSEPQCRGSIIRSTDGGQTWPLAGIQHLTDKFPMEQCSVSSASEDLVVFMYALNTLQTEDFTATLHDDDSGWSASQSYIDLARRSVDGGHTWDKATPLTPHPLSHSAIHAPMIELEDGTLMVPLCGALTSKVPGFSGPQQHPQCVVRSHDRGLTWGNGSIVALDPSGRRKYHQASLVPLPNDTILALMHSEEFIKLPDGREAREVNAWLCRSHDLGRTWGEPESLPFRVTGSATSTIRLQDGRLLITWSDRQQDGPSMRAAVSDDDGHTWSDPEGWSFRDGEHLPGSNPMLQAWTHDGSVFGGTYSDIGEPCTVQLADGRIITVYYWADPDNTLRYIEAAIFSVD